MSRDRPVWEHPAVARGIEAQLGRLRRDLDAGHRLLGWKLGLGSPSAMEQAGIAAPLVGFLTSRTVLPVAARVAVRGWTRPVLEPELAIRMGRDLREGASHTDAATAIHGVGPAIELADVDRPFQQLDAIVAENIFHRYVIFGDASTVRTGSGLSGMAIRVTKNRAQAGSTTDPTALTGDLPRLTAHVADWLAAAGMRLQAGHVIIAGSVIPIVPVEPGDEVVYHCDPLGSLDVEFA
jgi:2-oxo-3-hexenedioate decarboxylase